MAASPMMPMAAAIANLNAALALLNVGGTAGHIGIWSGSLPATCETADDATSAHQLSSGMTLSTTAFPTAVDGGSNGLATATASTIASDTNAANSGTAGYFRAYCSGSGAGSGGSHGCIIQGTCGTSSADMILSTTTITAGQTVSATSWVVTLPDGSGAD